MSSEREETMPDFDIAVAALVLNFGWYPFHHGTLGVIRSLGRLGIPVFTVQRNLLVPSGISRYLSGKFLWKSDGENVDHFLDGMATIAKKLDRPTILVPTDDLSAILIAENSHLLFAPSVFQIHICAAVTRTSSICRQQAKSLSYLPAFGDRLPGHLFPRISSAIAGFCGPGAVPRVCEGNRTMVSAPIRKKHCDCFKPAGTTDVLRHPWGARSHQIFHDSGGDSGISLGRLECSGVLR
jgi:hypothetical protein